MKLGLALGGGGARGSYQIGVIKALIESGLLADLKIVAGTSIGAINACLVMGELTFEQMESVWMHLDNNELYGSIDRFKQDKLGIFNQRRMYDSLVKLQSKEAIRNSKIKGLAVACRVKELGLIKQALKSNVDEVIFTLNELEDPHLAVLASSSIPVVFGPTKIGDDYYVDGGLVNNLPIDHLIDEGCTVIYAISLDQHYDLSKYPPHIKIIDFSPKTKLSKTVLGILNFSEQNIKDKIARGYNDALVLIKELNLNEKNLNNI